MKQKLLSILLLSLFALSAMAQSRDVTGKVTGADDNLPLPGVTVKVQGSRTGVETDAAGNFTIRINSPADVLIFSYIGYQPQSVVAGSNNNLAVKLVNSAKQLSEVVVTGYTSVNKAKSVSAASVVTSKDINDVPMPDINQILQGHAAGLVSTSSSGQPGAAQDVIIRGVGSLSAGTSPLYVIDGIILARGDYNDSGDFATQTTDVLANINPNDIENVTVLKDASALALYGARGSNGVIVINTKKGKNGTSTITARAQYGYDRASFGNWKLLDGKQVFDYDRNVLKINGYPQGQINSFFPDSLLKHTFNWVDAAFRTGRTSDYEISSQGGDDKTQYYLSTGIFNQDGALIYSSLKRYSVLSNISHQVNKQLDISLNINASYSNTQNALGGGYFASPILGVVADSPLQSPYKPDGTLYTGLEPEWTSITADNFLYSYPLNTNTDLNLRTLGKLNINYKFSDLLKLSQNVSADLINAHTKGFTDPTTADGYNSSDPSKSGDILEELVQFRSLTSQSSVSGKFSLFNDKNQFDYLGLFEYQGNNDNNFIAEGTGLASGKLKVLNVTSTPTATAGDEDDYNFVSYLGQFNYAYDNKYYLSASFRRDGSSRFGVDNKYGNFYSIGGSWKISDEGFMKNQTIFQNAKLRASYGTAGNASFGNYQSLQLYSYGATYNGSPGSVPSSIGNPNLTWEKSSQADIGLEFGVLKNRLKATIDVYNKITNGLLQNVPISATSGFTTTAINVGKLRNQGYEITLSSDNVKDGPFKWTTDLNFAFNRNKVLALNGNQDIIGGTLGITRVGLPIGSWYMKQYAGVDPANGDALFYKADGTKTNDYNEAETKVLGTSLPKYTGGITNTFTYQGFVLSAFFYANIGNTVFNQLKEITDSDGQQFGWNYDQAAIDNYWTHPGQNATNPKPIPGGNGDSASPSSRYLESGTYLRLRDITFGYNIPNSALKKLNVSSARIYVQGTNLLTFTGYTGIDPENGLNGNDILKYPVSKSVTFGIDLTL